MAITMTFNLNRKSIEEKPTSGSSDPDPIETSFVILSKLPNSDTFSISCSVSGQVADLLTRQELVVTELFLSQFQIWESHRKSKKLRISHTDLSSCTNIFSDEELPNVSAETEKGRERQLYRSKSKMDASEYPADQQHYSGQSVAAYSFVIVIHNNLLIAKMFFWDDIKLNGHSYGLWNYEMARNIKGEPKRSSLSNLDQLTQASEKAVYFMNDSFLCLNNSPITPSNVKLASTSRWSSGRTRRTVCSGSGQTTRDSKSPSTSSQASSTFICQLTNNFSCSRSSTRPTVPSSRSSARGHGERWFRKNIHLYIKISLIELKHLFAKAKSLEKFQDKV